MSGTPVSANFKLIFLTVLVLTILSLGGAIYLSLGNQTPSVQETTRHLWTIVDGGIGSIFGLLGGKAI